MFFPLAKVGCFLYFLCFFANIYENVTGFLMEYPEQEGTHKDHQSLAPKRIIPMDAPTSKPLSDTNSTPKLLQLEEASKALWTAQIFPLFSYQAATFPNFYHQNLLDFLLSVAQVFVLHFLNSWQCLFPEWGRSHVRMRSPGSLCSFACRAWCQFAYFGTWTLQITPYDQQIRCHLRARVQEMSCIYLPRVLRVNSGVLAPSTRLACLVLFTCQKLYLWACNCLINDITDAAALETGLFGHWPKLNGFSKAYSIIWLFI